MFDLSRKKLKIIEIVSLSLLVILILLVIVIPLSLQPEESIDYSSKTFPSLSNIDLWAKFPGKLKSSLKKTFGIFSYDNDNPKINEKFSIEEKIEYKNFTQKGNNIFFDTNRKFIYDKNYHNNNTINSINMGMFEFLETLTNPPLYKIGINSLHYLKMKTMENSETFIKKLFSYRLFQELKEKKFNYENESLFENISKEKVSKIYNNFNSINGIYQWVKILGETKIRENKEAMWIFEVYKLTDEEIEEIFGKEKFFYKKYIDYKKEILENFHCDDEKDLIYLQLINGNIIYDKKDLKSFYQEIKAENYPFDFSLEFKFFFENEYIKYLNDLNLNYEDYAPTINELDSLINEQSPKNLFYPENALMFLEINNTSDNEKAKLFFGLTIEKLNFLSEYFYTYLPKIFLYQEISETKIKISPLAKTYSFLIQPILLKTWKFLKEQKLNLFDFLYSKIIWKQIQLKLLFSFKDYQHISEEICPLLMQKVLNEGKKVLQICSDELLSFNSDYSFKKWLDPYECIINKNNTLCNMTLINYLKKKVFISKRAIEKIYNSKFIGGAINDTMKEMQEAFGCGGNCTNEGLLKLQFWKAIVTKNAPKPFVQVDSLRDWFPDQFPDSVEIINFLTNIKEKDNYMKDIKEADIDYLINLTPQETGDILKEENAFAFGKKILLEKDFSLYINNLNNEKKSLFKLINILINYFVFKNGNLINKYSSSKNLLQGNNQEDKYWIEKLNSGGREAGGYFDNYKPLKDKTSGFDFGEKNIFEKYEINSQRKIMSINEKKYFNIKEKEFSYLDKENKEVFIPLFDYETVNNNEKNFLLSDGFQYIKNSNKNENEIYYYDNFLSRPFKYIYATNEDFKGKIQCKKYIIDNKNLSLNINEKLDKSFNSNNNNQIAFISRKMNKPFIISVNSNKEIELKESEKENYICVDPKTSLVIDSKMNFIVSLFGRNYGYLYDKIGNEKSYPILLYQRQFEIDSSSYEKEFPGSVDNYHTFRVTFVVFGVIFIVILALVGAWSFYLLHRLPNIMKEIEDINKLSLADYDEFYNFDEGNINDQYEVIR